jgi:uncharacterized protein YbjT (DUF2867 family)
MNGLVLLTGASGYVGVRLLRALEKQGVRVRCLARRPDFLAGRLSPTTEVAAGDVLDPSSLDRALVGVHTAYYLVHSMGATTQYEELDRRGARNFGTAARRAGVKRIIYLGGLGEDGPRLSSHLRSRHEVGRLLGEAGVPVLEFRASIVIGSGSLSFEMIRSLVERLPVMITPRWVSVMAQPIGITDLLSYLVAGLSLPEGMEGVYEIGGADQMSYGGLMREYARQRGLKRWFISVPVLTPYLSSLWLGLVTPVYARVGRKLIDSIRQPTVVRDPKAREIFQITPMTARDAMALALRNEDSEMAATKWCDALSSVGPGKQEVPRRFGNRIVDSRHVKVPVPPAQAFDPIARIGGDRGWYFAQGLWRLRGFLDLLVRGPGLRRGRRNPVSLSVGDALDFWRVEVFEPNHRLRLKAEMRLPGRAWLEFEVRPEGDGSIIRQTALFDPVGLGGLAYWYGLYPIHRWIFSGMLKAIAKTAEGKGRIP